MIYVSHMRLTDGFIKAITYLLNINLIIWNNLVFGQTIHENYELIHNSSMLDWKINNNAKTRYVQALDSTV